jgi:peptidoglycan/LPS O-acetylase OafA/YrhL
MPQSRRLASLQALRGIAALAVVVFHLRGVELKYLDGPSVLDAIGRYADAGVDLFFVLSGFVMTTICAGRYTRPGEGVRFLVKRAWRVLPLYWFFTTIVVVLIAAVPSMVNTSYADQSALASYLLIPHGQLPLLTVGWTLVHEAYFYLVFAALLGVVPERFVPGVLLAWAGLIGAAGWMPSGEATPAHYLVTNPLTCEFIGGALLGLYWRRIPAQMAVPLMASGAVLAIVAAALLPTDGPASMSVWTRVALFGTAAVLLVGGAVTREAVDRLHVPALLLRMGDYSYSLYLTHVFVISAMGRIWATLAPAPGWVGHVAFVVITTAACCVVGRLVHVWLERPLLRLPHRVRGTYDKRAA